MARRTVLLLVVALGFLVGCSSGGSEGSAPATEEESETEADDTTSEGSGSSEDLPDARNDPASSSSSGGTGGCGGYDDEDVIIANCAGSATIRFTVDGAPHEITGGTCERFGEFFNVNAGVLLQPTIDEQVEPDSVTIQLPLADGDFGPDDETLISVAVDGVSYSADGATGSHDAVSVTFEGVDELDGVTVTGTVTC